MQFRNLLEISLVLLNTGHLSHASPNAEQYVPVILGNSKDISFVECTSTIKKEGGRDILLEPTIYYNTTFNPSAGSNYYKISEDSLKCFTLFSESTVCSKEVSRDKVAITIRNYFIDMPKVFQYICEAKLRFTNGTTSDFILKNNVTDDEIFASSRKRCQGRGWCNNQPGSANKRCCNSALCAASRSGGWHEPVCCFNIARKEVPSDITTRMAITKQTYFLALSLLVVFTMCSVILGLLQMIAMGKERRKQWKLLEARKRRGRLDDLKAVQKLRSLLQEQKENEPLLTVN